MAHSSLLNAKSRFPVGIFSDQYDVSSSGSGGATQHVISQKARSFFEGDDAFPNSARPPLVNYRLRTLFQVSGCSQCFSFSAASVCFLFISSQRLVPVHDARTCPFTSCASTSGTSAVLGCPCATLLPSLSPHSTFLPLLLCTGKPQSCGNTLTSFLAPISPLMTQRQLQHRLPQITCVSFQHKLGGVRNCSGVMVTCCSPSPSRQLPLFGFFSRPQN